MTDKRTSCTPKLKAGENDSGRAYIYFDEEVGIPSVDSLNIRFEFTDHSFEKSTEIAKFLTTNGFQLVVKN